MAILITDDCLNCGACEPECPHNAVYEGGTPWRWADGTKLTGAVALPGNFFARADAAQPPLQPEHYYIVPGKCNECVGFHEEPQCQAVCPVDCFAADPDLRETPAQLRDRARWLQQSDDPFTPYAAWLQTQPPTPPPGGSCGCH